MIPGSSNLFAGMEGFVCQLQVDICKALERYDRARFSTQNWDRPGGGGGITRVIRDGDVFEKGGVNVASVCGLLSDEAAAGLKVSPQQFSACGLSLVIHPLSPRIPSIHMNVRFFELENGTAWFGGGLDLTPYFPHAEDCAHFHRTLQRACDAVMPDSYRRFKAECDEYFYLPHRREMRGVGGVFFDYLQDDLTRSFDLARAVGESFVPSYTPIVERRKDEPFTDADSRFQLWRRGRYVEFNLLYDRGTKFGLATEGRTESILMSLPPRVEFPYDRDPYAHEPHARLREYYQPREWVGLRASIV